MSEPKDNIFFDVAAKKETSFGKKTDLPYESPEKFGAALAQRHLSMIKEAFEEIQKNTEGKDGEK